MRLGGWRLRSGVSGVKMGWAMGSVPFHSKPSCSLKNSRNAGSSFKDDSSLAVCFEAPVGATELLRSAAVVLVCERHIWARSPSS